MKLSAIETLSRLRRLGKQTVTTADASLLLGQTPTAVSWALARLARLGLVLRLRHGLWSLDTSIDPLLLPESLTAPFPSYISFQSAMRYHGMISQIPHVIFVASLAPTRKVKTSSGTYSIHRIAPSFFGGFKTTEKGTRIATPEKALLDALYLTPARNRLFAHLPEVELTPDFDKREARRWLARVPAGPRRSAMEKRLDLILEPRRVKRQRPRAAKAKPRPRASRKSMRRRS